MSVMMSEVSPSKRRKTTASSAMTPEQGEVEGLTTPRIVLTLEAVHAPPWPAGALPIEIFNLILNYLPRSSVQTMRLVNKEFESKVSHYLFKVVVLPFRPEIYGISPGPELAASQYVPMDNVLRDAVKLQHKGMKVFQGFGRKIIKFAMSFEFDEEQLSFPPVKSDQESITSFWGVYRWPFKKYNRYAQLEGLEQAADETGTMTEALSCIVHAKELGISIDGGLGWLAGPDANDKAAQSRVKLPIFGESVFAPEPEQAVLSNGLDVCNVTEELLAKLGITAPAIKAALQQAGYEGDSLDESVQMLLQGEALWERVVRGEIFDHVTGLNWTVLAHTAAEQRQIAASLLAAEDTDNPDGTAAVSDDSNDSESPPGTPEIASKEDKRTKDEDFPLKPNELTNAQREMLLEVEWAQRAFMQSYTIAIIDNKATFQHIEALNIARLPSRHLPILRRTDFWDSLPRLKSLSLAIIPDWRDVIKLPTSWVQDDKVLPSQAVAVVYKILEEHVLRRQNIKTLHFEWICGGEEAPGLFARNQHVLPAPVVPVAMEMIHRDILPELLSFPYVEHLSLKNCWITPHIMATLSLSLRSSALKSLTFNSVSLTAPLALNAHPNIIPETRTYATNAQLLVNTAAAHNQFMNMQAGVGAVIGPNILLQAPPPNVVGPAQAPMPSWLGGPRFGSWTQFINCLTPGKTLADLRYARGHGEKPSDRGRTNLSKIRFESCGYVRLPLDFDQSVLDPPDLVSVGSSVSKRVEGLDHVMMKSDDPAQGTIVNYIQDIEKQILEEGFDMTANWDASRSALFAEALFDGITHPGRGRFSGIIDVGPTSSY